VTQISDWL